MKTLPDWLLERALVDEIPAGQTERVLAATAHPEVAARIRALQDDSERLFAELPPGAFAAEVRRRCPRVRPLPRRRMWTILVPMIAGAAAIAALVLLRAGGSSRHSSEEPTLAVGPSDIPTERVKGAPQLLIHRRAGQAAESLSAGDVTHDGDRLQVSYVSAGARYGVIISIDGRGVVTRHLPENGAAAAVLSAHGRVHLRHSYVLDDAPGFERFVFVTSQAPFSVNSILDAARAVARDPSTVHEAALPLAAELSQQSFLLRKGAAQ